MKGNESESLFKEAPFEFFMNSYHDMKLITITSENVSNFKVTLV